MPDIRNTAIFAWKGVDPDTGLLVDFVDGWTNWEPIELGAGSTVAPAREGIELQVSCYKRSFADRLDDPRSIRLESNRTVFQPGMGTTEPIRFGNEPWICPEDCFVRVTARIADGYDANEVLSEPRKVGAFKVYGPPQTLGDLVTIDALPATCTPLPEALDSEIERVSNRVNALREPGDLVLVLITDIHYATGSIWSDTIRTIRGVSERIAPDAIVQLGDLVEGTVPDRVAESFATRVLEDLRSCGIPVLGCVGNHDVDRLSDNRRRLTDEHFALLCTGTKELWYRVDFPESQTSCLFLKSYAPKRDDPFGFENEQRHWLHTELVRMQRGWKLLIFSHVPLHAGLHRWSDAIKNENAFRLMLNRFNRTHNGALAAFINGHNHTDQVYLGDRFPNISVGCARFENPRTSDTAPTGTDARPTESDTDPTVGAPTKPARRMGTASQELWDVLVLKKDGRLELVRFGAGEDVIIPAPGSPGIGPDPRSVIR